MEIYVTMENPRERGASSKMWKRSTLGGTTEAAAMGTGGPGPRLLSHTPVLSGHACLLVAGLVGAGAPGHVAVKGLIRTDCPSGPGPGQLRLSPSQWPHSDPRLVSHARTAARYSHSRPGATPSVHSEGCPIQEVGFQMAPHGTPGRTGFVSLWAGEGTAGLWRPRMDSGRGLLRPLLGSRVNSCFLWNHKRKCSRRCGSGQPCLCKSPPPLLPSPTSPLGLRLMAGNTGLSNPGGALCPMPQPGGLLGSSMMSWTQMADSGQ